MVIVGIYTLGGNFELDKKSHLLFYTFITVVDGPL